MDAAAQYRQLLQLGREAFLASAAPAALVRYRAGSDLDAGSVTLTIDQQIEETLSRSRAVARDLPFEVYPLAKKPGAAYPDRITIGRTPNNDLVIADTSISRFHAYLRRSGDGWVVADAGSKNGSTLRGVPLEARREQPIASRVLLKLGDVELTFYLAADLYAALGGPS